MTTDEKIGEHVREHRDARGFSQAHIAAVMNLKGFHTWDKSVVGKVELGKRSLKLTEAVALCGPAVLGCSLTDLVGT